jgi:hypothetical protein
MTTINLKEWPLTHEEFKNWIEESGAEVYAYIHYGMNGVASATYEFARNEDLLAFELRYSRNDNHFKI